jgi:hypothetical protein
MSDCQWHNGMVRIGQGKEQDETHEKQKQRQRQRQKPFSGTIPRGNGEGQRVAWRLHPVLPFWCLPRVTSRV